MLEAKNMTIKEFSDITGISYRSAMNYLNEGRDPNVDALVKIHKGVGINITWLLTGIGEIFEPLPVKQESNISNQEKELLSYYRIMPKSLQEVINLSFKEIYKITNNFRK